MLILPVLLAASLAVGSDEFDRAANEGAAEISIARIRAERTSANSSPGKMREAMLADPGIFRDPAAAETECRLLYTAEAEAAFLRDVKRVVERLHVEPGSIGVFTEEDRVKALATFPDEFARERAEACEEQAKGIVASVRPTEEEFDRTDEAALRETMTSRLAAAQEKPVFEENLRYISEKIVDPMFEGAKKERKRQGEYFMRARSEAFAPSRLADDLAKKLAANVAEHKAEAEDPTEAWNVFPSVLETALPKAVERRTLERVSAQVADVPVEVTAEGIAAVIADDPVRHVKTDESEKAFREIYAAAILNGAVSRAAEGCPEGERAEFDSYVTEHLAGSSASKAIAERIRSEVLPRWRVAREEASRAEAERTYPRLVDGTWFPGAELADETVARSDYAVAVSGWRTNAALRDLLPPQDVTPMEETERTADESVARAFDRARDAVAAQNAIVEKVHPAVLEEAVGRKESFFRRTPDFKTLVELLTTATEDRWREERASILWPSGEMPSNAAEQHTALFPSVRRKIELVARTILEEMNEKKDEEKPPEEAKPEEPPPEEPPPEETPPEETPPEEEPPLVEFSIIVNREGENVKVKLEKGRTTVAERTPKAEMNEFSEAMKFISDKLGREILELK